MSEGEKTQPILHRKLRAYFLNTIGQIVDSAELQAVSGGVVDLAQHIRELGDEEGYRILTHADRNDLLPGQYLLESATPEPVFSPAVSAKMRAYVLKCRDLTCQMCGAAAGDPDEDDPEYKLRLHIAPLRDANGGGEDGPSNLRVLCSSCHEGVSGTPLDRGPNLLLDQLQSAGGTAQLEALAWLVKKFPHSAKFYLGDGA